MITAHVYEQLMFCSSTNAEYSLFFRELMKNQECVSNVILTEESWRRVGDFRVLTSTEMQVDLTTHTRAYNFKSFNYSLSFVIRYSHLSSLTNSYSRYLVILIFILIIVFVVVVFILIVVFFITSAPSLQFKTYILWLISPLFPRV